MKIRISRHHSNGPIEICHDSLYPGVQFDMTGGSNVFLEVESAKENPNDIKGLAIRFKEDGWHVSLTDINNDSEVILK